MVEEPSEAKLATLYHTAPAPWHLREMMNKRRRIISPVPFMDLQTWVAAKEELFALLPEAEGYEEQIVAEQASRPIVDVTDGETFRQGTDIFKSWYPEILEKQLPLTRKLPYVFNNKSRLGAPFCKRMESKRDACMPLFRDLAVGSETAMRAALDGLYTMINIRLQPEKAQKERIMTFVSRDGVVHRTKMTREFRTVTVPSAGVKGLAERTRTIFMPCYVNLMLQMLSSTLHDTLLRTRLCGHDMFRNRDAVLPRGAEAYMCTDIHHMDHHSGACASFMSEVRGGLFNTAFSAMFAHPFLVPSDDWSENLWVWSRGVTQFPSGFSDVAEIQKLYHVAAYSEFMHKHRGMTREAALDFVWNGGDTAFTIRNYGDDNALAGKRANLDDWLAFASEFCDIEVEDPPKFLGFVWTGQAAGFRLTAASYVLKTWLYERQPFKLHRPYPCHGWVLKRKAYSEFGDPERMERVYQLENDVLAKYGVPWHVIEDRASVEARLLSSAESHPYALMGKEYLLSEEERAALPGNEFVPADEAAPMAAALLAPEHVKKMYGTERLALTGAF
jgi:hypothetical protein